MEINKRYLFIGGVGRSGTSSITEIVGSHHRIVLGMERYNKLFRKQEFLIKPLHFEKERFLNIQPNDTFYSDFNKFRVHKEIPQKWDNALYVGVKYPRFITVYEDVKCTLGEFKLIYIYRNIFDVTESWNRRLIEANRWPKNRDHKVAVSFWNNSLLATQKLMNQKKDIICVSYEDLFFTEKSIEPLFSWLGLDLDKKVSEVLARKRKIAPEKKAKKGHLSTEQKEYIEQNARFDLYEKFNESFNIIS